MRRNPILLGRIVTTFVASLQPKSMSGKFESAELQPLQLRDERPDELRRSERVADGVVLLDRL